MYDDNPEDLVGLTDDFYDENLFRVVDQLESNGDGNRTDLGTKPQHFKKQQKPNVVVSARTDMNIK